MQLDLYVDVDYIFWLRPEKRQNVSQIREPCSNMATGGHWASLAKLQFCQKSMNYLGMSISVTGKSEQYEGHCKTKEQNGDVFFSRIVLLQKCEGFLNMRFTMQKCAKPNTKTLLKSFSGMRKRHMLFVTSSILCTAPALGLPDYKLTFHLYAADNGETVSTSTGTGTWKWN